MNRKMSPQRVILTLDPVSLWSVTNYMWRGGGGGEGSVVSTVSHAMKMHRWKFLRRKKRPLSWFGRGKVKQPPNSWSVVEQKHIPANNLGAVEIEGRVYFIINKFPVDSGIRIQLEDTRQFNLEEWKNLTTVNKEAFLCYLPVKKEDLT